MNKTVGKIIVYTLSGLLAAGVIALLIFLDVNAAKSRSLLTCSGLDVEITDRRRLNFVTKADVKNILDKEYGVYKGQRLESVDLRRIENILDGRSAILKSQAYVTKDGVLHVQITQRSPVVRFNGSNGRFYADETGFIFPLQRNYTSRVPIIDGQVPLSAGSSFKGYLDNPKEKEWLQQVILLMDYLASHGMWKDAVAQITVTSDKDLVMILRHGSEKFIFGTPDEFDEKFDKIEYYFKYIAPNREPGYYSTVNLKYRGQIVCRK